MKNLIFGLVTCGLLAGAIASASGETLTEGRAKVVRVKGAARYMMPGKDWQPLHAGDILKPGAVIQTSKDHDSFVDVVLGEAGPVATTPTSTTANTTTLSYQPNSEQNIVRIWENSVLGIDKLTSMDTGADMVSETQLDLKSGHIFGSVKKMSAASKYEVKIPNGVAGIRGTVYDINANGIVRCSAGSVVVAYMTPDGTVVTKVLVGNQQIDTRTGEFTPLPPELMRSFQKVEHEALAGRSPTTPVVITVDHTIYTDASPVHGHGHGHGHGNGNGNGNDNGNGD